MERDILDDYKDFLLSVKERLLFEVIPTIACVDEDGDIKQDFLFEMQIPGVGAAQGCAVAWIKPELFRHGLYDEPCRKELVFHAIRIPETDEHGGKIVEELIDGEWQRVYVPPDPGLEDIEEDTDADEYLNNWFRDMGL